MKNIQVIDGAENCTYDIFSLDENDFIEIFPGNQDVEFAEDFQERVGSEKATEILSRLWRNRVDRKKVIGIHGTIFFQLQFKKQYYPTKKEREMTVSL